MINMKTVRCGLDILFNTFTIDNEFTIIKEDMTMLGNFSFCNPTKLYFGDESLNFLNTELPKYGENVVLIYGGGSIKKNGIYDAVIKIL